MFTYIWKGTKPRSRQKPGGSGIGKCPTPEPRRLLIPTPRIDKASKYPAVAQGGGGGGGGAAGID